MQSQAQQVLFVFMDLLAGPIESLKYRVSVAHYRAAASVKALSRCQGELLELVPELLEKAEANCQ
jgi:hypothetical protein